MLSFNDFLTEDKQGDIVARLTKAGGHFYAKEALSFQNGSKTAIVGLVKGGGTIVVIYPDGKFDRVPDPRNNMLAVLKKYKPQAGYKLVQKAAPSKADIAKKKLAIVHKLMVDTVGQHAPDDNGWDEMFSKAQKRGIYDEGEFNDLLDKAAQREGYRTFDDYFDDFIKHVRH